MLFPALRAEDASKPSRVKPEQPSFASLRDLRVKLFSALRRNDASASERNRLRQSVEILEQHRVHGARTLLGHRDTVRPEVLNVEEGREHPVGPTLRLGLRLQGG